MAERRPQPGARVPEWLVERLAAHELPPAQAAGVRARLQESGELSRLSALEESNRALLEAHPPSEVAAEVKRRLARASATPAPAPAGRTWGWLALSGAAAAALSVALFSPLQHEQPAPPLATSGDGVRLRGLEPHLVLYKKTPAGAVRLEPPARATPGDVVQLAYVAAGRKYGAIASIDSTGTVTLHLPEARGPAVPLVPQSETPLPHAFELDDAPGAERFLFVTSDQPFDADTVTSALREGAALPAQLTTHQLQLEKNSHD